MSSSRIGLPLAELPADLQPGQEDHERDNAEHDRVLDRLRPEAAAGDRLTLDRVGGYRGLEALVAEEDRSFFIGELRPLAHPPAGTHGTHHRLDAGTARPSFGVGALVVDGRFAPPVNMVARQSPTEFGDLLVAAVVLEHVEQRVAFGVVEPDEPAVVVECPVDRCGRGARFGRAGDEERGDDPARGVRRYRVAPDEERHRDVLTQQVDERDDEGAAGERERRPCDPGAAVRSAVLPLQLFDDVRRALPGSRGERHCAEATR